MPDGAQQPKKLTSRQRVVIRLIGAPLILGVVIGLLVLHHNTGNGTSTQALLALLGAVGGLELALLLRHGTYTPRQGWRSHSLKVALASVAMSAAVLALNPDTAAWVAGDSLWRALRLTGVIAAGAACYVLVLLALGLRPRHLAAPTSGQR